MQINEQGGDITHGHDISRDDVGLVPILHQLVQASVDDGRHPRELGLELLPAACHPLEGGNGIAERWCLLARQYLLECMRHLTIVRLLYIQKSTLKAYLKNLLKLLQLQPLVGL